MTTAEASPELLTVQEVAARLRVSVSTVRRLVAAGDLQPMHVGRQLRFPVDELNALLRVPPRHTTTRSGRQ